MCGICGFTGPANQPLLSRMAGTLAHRGPDGEGYHADGRINLGMRRLAIVDPQTGHQPVRNETGDVVAVFNGEIYNFRELRAGLAKRGHRFVTHHSDSETIVHLYEEHGEAFPERLNGMFAIALWDAARGTLLLVRDRLGVKPLFYAEAGGELLFASEIKGLLAHPAVRQEPDREALYHYFTLKHIPAPFTAFAGVRALRPGELLVRAAGGSALRRWWRPAFREVEPPDEPGAQRALVELLDDAVRLRMACDVPYGAYLSGGLDSSTVVALMRRHAPGRLKTFSLGYRDGFARKEADLVHAREVAALFGTEHYEHLMTHQELVEDLDAVVGAFDQPFAGVASTYFLTKLIGRHVKVALSGDGADEIFGSYRSHRTAPALHHYARLRSRALAGELSPEESELLLPCEPAELEALFGACGTDEACWRERLYFFRDDEKAGLLSPAFREGLAGSGTLGLLREDYADLTASDPLNRVLEAELRTQLPDQVLAFVDFLSMAHGVEVRSPFLDYRVVEFAATIPGRLKIRGGVVKDFLKRAVAPLLPAGVVNRPKEGFVLPVNDWLEGGLEPFCRSTLAGERLRRHGWLSPQPVSDLVTAFYGGRRELAGRIWTLVMFQLWWERYFG